MNVTMIRCAFAGQHTRVLKSTGTLRAAATRWPERDHAPMHAPMHGSRRDNRESANPGRSQAVPVGQALNTLEQARRGS